MNDSVFILTNPSVTIATECTIFLISVIGLFFNCLAVYITIFRYRSRNTAIWLIIFIAITDTLFSINDIVTQVFKWTTSHQVLIYPEFCQFSGTFYTLFIITSIDGVGILSLLRVVSITSKTEPKTIFWYIAIGVLLSTNIILSILGVYNRIMRIMPSEVYCKASFLRSKFSRLYSEIVIAKFCIMLLIIIISYFYITIRYYKTASRLNSKNDSTGNCFIVSKPAIAYQRWIITRLLVLVLMYMICFLPELIQLFYNISTNTDRTPIGDAIASCGISFTIVVNSVFVLFYHKEITIILTSMLPNWIRSHTPNMEIIELGNF